MASVFLSYDHDDAIRAAPIASALEKSGHSVWWDRHIHGGAEYNTEIEGALERADVVVVLWSERSVRSTWVRDEAAEGRDRAKLVPVSLDRAKPPMGFGQYQTIDLSGWNGGKRIPPLPELLHSIERVVGAGTSAPALAPAALLPTKRAPTSAPSDGRLSRRMVLGSGAAGVAALIGGGVWWTSRQRVDPRFQALIDQAQEAIRHQSIDQQTVRVLEQALSIRPRSAQTLGLLSLVKSLIAQSVDPKDAAGLVADAERMARRALSIDPKEPNALLAMFELQGSTLNWFTRDQKLRQIIGIDPKNVVAVAELVLLTQATGFIRESWAWNERAVSLEPLSADFLGKRALKLWVLGRTSESDKVSDQLRGLYPTDMWAWWVRFVIYAFTGRAQAAQAMLDGDPTMGGRPTLARLWKASLPALDQPLPGTIANARKACITAAQLGTQLASQAVLVMSALHEMDTAFDIANGLLLSRGPLVRPDKPASTWTAQDASWRINTQWMFSPPTAPMRADRRFLPLCDNIGLTDYWKARNTRPDYQRT